MNEVGVCAVSAAPVPGRGSDAQHLPRRGNLVRWRVAIFLELVPIVFEIALKQQVGSPPRAGQALYLGRQRQRGPKSAVLAVLQRGNGKTVPGQRQLQQVVPLRRARRGAAKLVEDARHDLCRIRVVPFAGGLSQQRLVAFDDQPSAVAARKARGCLSPLVSQRRKRLPCLRGTISTVENPQRGHRLAMPGTGEVARRIIRQCLPVATWRQIKLEPLAR